MERYTWPILLFVAVSFWNLVGAGLLGFLINPPISLYYVQGLNTTPAHGHAALFGVYGLLGIGLMLFSLRGLSRDAAWNDSLLKSTFWLLNGGHGVPVAVAGGHLSGLLVHHRRIVVRARRPRACPSSPSPGPRCAPDRQQAPTGPASSERCPGFFPPARISAL